VITPAERSLRLLSQWSSRSLHASVTVWTAGEVFQAFQQSSSFEGRQHVRTAWAPRIVQRRAQPQAEGATRAWRGSVALSSATVFVERRFERAVAAFAPDRRQEAALACTRAMDRQRRQIAPNAKQKALAQLASLKQNGIKRSDQFQVRAAHSRLAHAAASRIA
jgi:hypothetical protein